MKVAIYTLTRDRLDYTKHCFKVLRERAGYLYDHFVVDNGSTDGTPEWLRKNAKHFQCVNLLPENAGISLGSNLALKDIAEEGHYDLIIKMDNDCEIVTPGLLGILVDVYSALGAVGPQFILSPTVGGLAKQRILTPVRFGSVLLGRAGHVGGIFCCVPTQLHRLYTYPNNLPKAAFQDSNICQTLQATRGATVGYVISPEIKVNHYETTAGQNARYPEYMKRAKIEKGFKPVAFGGPAVGQPNREKSAKH